MKRSNLHEYQNCAADFIKKRRKCALFLDMGLGKTVTTLTAASDFLDDLYVDKVLIIAPLRVANTVWQQEAEKWEHLKHLNISICTGSAKERKLALTKGYIHIINRENIPWLLNNISVWDYQMIIIDESSSFKSAKSKRFKALKSVCKYVKSMVLLTGTPSPNGLLDLWSQLYLIDNGERLGRTMSIYKNRFFTPSGYGGFKFKPIKGAQDTIMGLISDVCMTMKAEDYIKLPERIDINQYVTMSNETSKIYKEIAKEFIITLDGENDIVALSSAALANKLLQICNGAIYDADGNFHEINDDKLLALKDIIDDNPAENFLIAYNYKSDLIRIKKMFPKATVLDKSANIVADWNRGKIKILLAHPQSAGHGLNLQTGGACVVWFGLNWSLELYQQFNARLHRQGQNKTVKIIHLVMKGGIDEKVLNALENKAKTQDELLNYLKVNFK